MSLSTAMSGEPAQPAAMVPDKARGKSFLLESGRMAAKEGSAPRAKIRLPISYRGISGLVASMDFAIILICALISGDFYNFAFVGGAEEFSRSMAAAVFVAVLFVASTSLRQFYDPSRLTVWYEQVHYLIGAWCGTFLLMASGVFAWGVGKELSRGTLLLFWALGGVALMLHRAFWRIYLPVAVSSGALKGRKSIVVTWDQPVDAALNASISRHGNDIVAQLVIKDDDDRLSDALKRLVDFARGASIDEIFLVPKASDPACFGKVLESLRILPFPVVLVPDAATTQLLRCRSYELGPHLAVEVQRPPLSQTEQALKRTFDIVLSSIALITILPLLVMVAATIALDSRGPVLFRQTRHGFNGKPFKIFKFRTMSVLEDGEHVGQAKPGDKRVTRVGAWLRRSSIDELPQLLNVLNGDMSVVGPRPHAVAHERYFEKVVENYAYRQRVKSGITGWAQVNGARGETDTLEKIKVRVDLDLWYIKNWSLYLDLIILLRTVSVVLSGRNAV